ncbi:MAG TPA: carboxypeptidase-like regulatory domain-containing protein, partial [Agriterribacter sp.]|nr:carboxypeptidase-like regulatory domain-containing protein [Agriterribacter sp.]
MKLEQALSLIQKQSGYSFFWDRQLVSGQPDVALNVRNASVVEALDACFKGLALTYEIKGAFVYIMPGAVKSPIPADDIPLALVTGKVTDEKNNPLQGVTVLNVRTQTATQTRELGQFNIEAERGDTLEFTFVGYEKVKREVVSLSHDLVISLKLLITDLGETVIVGYGSQKRASLTGSVATISSKDLTT